MKKEQILQAVLIPPQLEQFCRAFDLCVDAIEPNFSGWSKHILMSPDRVFLFPRHPDFVPWLEKELQLYDVFTHLFEVPLPKLIQIVDDEKLSYYRFGVVTRMHGVVFSTVEPEIGPDAYETLLCHLGRLTAVWHGIPLTMVSKVVAHQMPDASGGDAGFYDWMRLALSPKTVGEGLDVVVAVIDRLVKDLAGFDSGLLTSTESRSKWGAVLEELARLDPVLIHGDVHEDQIFIRSRTEMEITGIIDWGTATIANPVFDFNFGEWGFAIWRFRDHFHRFRRVMWQEYLRARNLHLSTLEGLHLFYTFQELYWATRKNRPIIAGGRTLEEELRNILETLNRVTKAI